MIDKHDAPEGYIAVKSLHLCKGCVFRVLGNCNNIPYYHSCLSASRKDRYNVIFIPDPDKQPNKETEQVMQDIVNGDNVEQVEF